MEQAGPAGSPDPLIGLRVGNYEITARIGSGGMGAVYLATHPQLELQVAIKVLDPRLLSRPRAADRFLDEARAATRIDHPGVIRIHDFGQLPEVGLYYVMEALQGRDLGALLEQEGPRSPAWALALLEQICPALQAAHDQGVVHRDLKPTNIFALEGAPPQFKLLDFGIARLLQGQQAGQDQSSAGIVMGTPQYIAPEQAAGQPSALGPQTDIYSLGTILYQVLSGRLPIVAADPTTLLYKQVTAQPISLLQVRPGLPRPLAAVVHRCLEKAPSDRHAGAMELLGAFREALGQTPAESVVPAAPVGTRRRAGLLLLVLALAVAGAAAWLMAGPAERSPAAATVEPKSVTPDSATAPDSSRPDSGPAGIDLAQPPPDPGKAPAPGRVRPATTPRRHSQPAPRRPAPAKPAAPRRPAPRRNDVFNDL